MKDRYPGSDSSKEKDSNDKRKNDEQIISTPQIEGWVVSTYADEIQKVTKDEILALLEKLKKDKN